MKIVGLTGGIGSGKSTVARTFEKLGAPIYIADLESKKILDSDPMAIEEIKELLGEQSYEVAVDGSLIANRPFIASKVFQNKELLERLNTILHPKVRAHFEEWCANQSFHYVVYEAAILLESGGATICDYIVLVTAPLKDRIARVMKRDQITEVEVRERLQNQWSDQQRLEKSDFLIINDDLELIHNYVNYIHEFMLKNY
jgi:dephospho-CoA kinase